jgi:hypothetical protein
MQQMLRDIGRHLCEGVDAENERGRGQGTGRRSTDQQVGARLRDMMPFLDPVHVRPDMQG